MTKNDDDNDDENLLKIIEECLCTCFPNINKFRPPSYPRHSKLKITVKKMEEYAKERESIIWTHFNLPFALYWFLCCPDKEKQSLAKSVLDIIEWFAKEMSGHLGAKSVIGPIFNTAWDSNDSRIWSVISEILITKHLFLNGAVIKGFGVTFGGKKNADVYFALGGKDYYLDVVIKNLTKKLPSHRCKLVKFINRIVEEKVSVKFQNLDVSRCGIVATVLIPKGDDLVILEKNSDILEVKHHKKNIFQSVHFLGVSRGKDNISKDVMLLSSKVSFQSLKRTTERS